MFELGESHGRKPGASGRVFDNDHSEWLFAAIGLGEELLSVDR